MLYNNSTNPSRGWTIGASEEEEAGSKERTSYRTPVRRRVPARSPPARTSREANARSAASARGGRLRDAAVALPVWLSSSSRGGLRGGSLGGLPCLVIWAFCRNGPWKVLPFEKRAAACRNFGWECLRCEF